MANDPQPRQYVERREYPGQLIGQSVALWLLVALVFFLNVQIMQLSGQMRQLQGDQQNTSLVPTGPAPDSAMKTTPDYQAELESIIGKMDRMGTSLESIDENVTSIHNELRGGGTPGGVNQPGGYPGQ